jgi:glucose-6-phosphate-specific signal transduction histidine kinase
LAGQVAHPRKWTEVPQGCAWVRIDQRAAHVRRFLIGYEAIRNACAHSGASQVKVEPGYAQDLGLRIRDDGVGIDAGVIERGKEGHFGLQGMRERAARIGGKLTVASKPGSGTEIKLVVPGGIVFKTIRTVGPGGLTRFRKLLARVVFKI